MRTTLSIRSQRTESAIPLRGYFLSVGGALLALLVASDRLLPHPAPGPIMNHALDHPVVRIRSDVKGPEAVVIDGAVARLAMLAEHDHSAASQGPPVPASETDNAPVEPSPLAVPTEKDDPASSALDTYAQLAPVPAPNTISKSNHAFLLSKRLPTALRHKPSHDVNPRTDR